MAYVDPKLRPRLESLSPELRAAILKNADETREYFK